MRIQDRVFLGSDPVPNIPADQEKRKEKQDHPRQLLPWMILFFLPLFLVRRDIWDWITAKENPVLDPHLRDKLSYFELRFGALVIPFFWVRAVLYFVYFSFAAHYFR